MAVVGVTTRYDPKELPAVWTSPKVVRTRVLEWFVEDLGGGSVGESVPAYEQVDYASYDGEVLSYVHHSITHIFERTRSECSVLWYILCLSFFVCKNGAFSSRGAM